MKSGDKLLAVCAVCITIFICCGVIAQAIVDASGC